MAMKFIFDTHGGDSELTARDGQSVIVLRALTEQEADIEDVGKMFRIRFDDGFEADAFADELTLDEVDFTPKPAAAKENATLIDKINTFVADETRNTFKFMADPYMCWLCKMQVQNGLVALLMSEVYMGQDTGKHLFSPREGAKVVAFARNGIIVGPVSGDLSYRMSKAGDESVSGRNEALNDEMYAAAEDIVRQEGRYKDIDMNGSGVVWEAQRIFFGKEGQAEKKRVFDENYLTSDQFIDLMLALPDVKAAAKIWLDTTGEYRKSHRSIIEESLAIKEDADKLVQQWESSPNCPEQMLRSMRQAMDGAKNVEVVFDAPDGPVTAKIPAISFQTGTSPTDGASSCEVSLLRITPEREQERVEKALCPDALYYCSGVSVTRVREIRYRGKTVYTRYDLKD